MAEKTMVVQEDERFIAAVKRVIARLQDSHGPLYAAILIRLADWPCDEWTFLAGSQKLVKRRVVGIDAIVDAMKGIIPREFATRIRHVDVLREDDPTYTYLSRAFQLEAGLTLTLDSCNIFGLEIARALVFVLRKPEATPMKRRAAKRRAKPGRAQSARRKS